MSDQVSAQLGIVGVSHFSDLYPNVRYKPEILAQMYDVSWHTHDLGKGGLYGNSAGAGTPGKVGYLVSLIWGHLKVFTGSLLHGPAVLYIVYPAVLLACMYSFVPRRWRPGIVIDAFISLYDTVVCDRELLPASSLRARLLFRLERRAFASADVVLVDTEENGDYYSSLFQLGREKFREVPLSIPEFAEAAQVTEESNHFRCFFLGSMVPLQGIEIILQAATLLRDEQGIEFVIVGDGQQGDLVEQYLQMGNTNLVWNRQALATDALVQEIRKADLCLGIFGATAKAERVIPYKLYYYAALHKPFVSLDSRVLQRIASTALACTGDAKSLATRIVALRDDKGLLADCGRASRALFDNHLNRAIQKQVCAEIFDLILNR